MGRWLTGYHQGELTVASEYSADLQPDITFFGQALDSSFDECLYADREEVDLLVIIGTSLKVAPVSEVLSEQSGSSGPRLLLIISTYTSLRPADLHQPHSCASCPP